MQPDLSVATCDADLPRGGFVGVVQMTGCISPEDRQRRISQWHVPSCYGYTIGAAKAIPFEAFRGQLGLPVIKDQLVLARILSQDVQDWLKQHGFAQDTSQRMNFR